MHEQALNGVACINGEFVPAQDATVSIFDSGFIGGVSIFDTLACWEGGLFKLPQHRARFERSAHAAVIPLRCSGAELEALIVETTRRAGLRNAYVQTIATRGRRPSPSMPSHEPTLGNAVGCRHRRRRPCGSARVVRGAVGLRGPQCIALPFAVQQIMLRRLWGGG